MGDDIVYLDIERFDEFINYIKLFEKNITFPNMVNHAISLFYNNKYDLVPDSLIKEKYQKKILLWIYLIIIQMGMKE